MTSPLSKFLKSANKSKARELLITSKVKYDTLLAAALSGYDLLVYQPTVDSDGFDIIFDDRRTLLPIQLKSTVVKANSWSIHRRLIRPEFPDLEIFGLHSPSHGKGKGGGVLLIEIKEASECDELNIRYFFSDFLILHLFLEKIINEPRSAYSKTIGLKHQIVDQVDGYFKLPKFAFLEAKSPEHFLALAGLGSRKSSLWREHMQDLLRYQNIQGFQSHLGTKEYVRQYVAEEVKKLVKPRAIRP